MKRLIIGVLGAGLVVGTALAQDAKTKAAPKAAPAQGQGVPADLKTTVQKGSYAIGVDLGRKFKGLDVDALTRGFKDAQSAKAAISPQQIQEVVQACLSEMATNLAETNKKDGADFLAANKKKEGVKTLPSGLQYKVLKDGNGPSPKANDRVSVNYRGTLLDGTEFDSSYAQGAPVEFGVSQVIPGWTEALQLMKVGSKWQLFVPPDLAYRERGTPGGPIGPNATLVFEVELLAINP